MQYDSFGVICDLILFIGMQIFFIIFLFVHVFKAKLVDTGKCIVNLTQQC